MSIVIQDRLPSREITEKQYKTKDLDLQYTELFLLRAHPSSGQNCRLLRDW